MLHEFKPPKLIGVDDLGDPKLSLHSLIASETIKEFNATPEHKEVVSRNGKRNVKSGHLANIRPLALKAFMESDYIGSEAFYDRSSKGGQTTCKLNIENGNVGTKESRMAIYKRAQNRKKWALLLLDLGMDEFLTSDTHATITGKTWFNITTRSNFVIKTDKRGGYHNTAHYYRLNLEAVLEAANSNPQFFKD
jgi:hypothetical protein